MGMVTRHDLIVRKLVSKVKPIIYRYHLNVQHGVATTKELTSQNVTK